MDKYSLDKITTGGFEVKIEPPTEIEQNENDLSLALEVAKKTLGFDIKAFKPEDEPSTSLKYTEKNIRIPLYERIGFWFEMQIWLYKTNARHHKEKDVIYRSSITAALQTKYGDKFIHAQGKPNSVTFYKNGDVIINNIGPLCGEKILYKKNGKKIILAIA